MELCQSRCLQREGAVPTWGTAQWGTVSLGEKWEQRPLQMSEETPNTFIIFFFSINSILFGSCIALRLGHIMTVLLLAPLCWVTWKGKDLSKMLLCQLWSLTVVSWRSRTHFQGCLSVHPTTTLKSCKRLCSCPEAVLEAAGAGGHYTKGFSTCRDGYAIGLHETERNSHLQIEGFSLDLSIFQRIQKSFKTESHLRKTKEVSAIKASDV